MTYRLRITEHAEELLDNLVGYLLHRFKSEQAARNLLDGVDNVYDRLEENPFQFPNSQDAYLGKMGYREAIVPQMDYIIIFSIVDDVVNVVGIFHQLENYPAKL